MKKVLLLGLLTYLGYFSYAQGCSSVPIVEAVRNGNFEAGYLPGGTIDFQGADTSSHIFTDGGIFDFQSDLNYAGEWKNENSICIFGIPNQYGVGRVENTTNLCDPGDAIVYGRYTNATYYKDHTTGTDKGFSMFVDFNQKSDYKKIWAQNVNIYPSQKYYFSAWFAQYGSNQIPPDIIFRIETYDKVGVLIESKKIGNAPVAPPAMTWQQFNGLYNTPDNAVTARLFIECKPTGQPASDNFMIDDISFINSCQNIRSFVNYGVEFKEKEVSLCDYDNSYTAQLKREDESTPLGTTNKTITWYKGTGNTQTELTAFANSVAPIITTPGNYRACVIDIANNGCTVNANITISENLDVTTIPSYNLCSPAQVTLNTNKTEAGLTHDWTVPNGATKSTTNEQVANVEGDYIVIVKHPNNANCYATSTSKITSNLPIAPTDLTYCSKTDSEIILSHPDNSKTWKWCQNQTCDSIIGVSDTPITWNLSNQITGDQTLYFENATTSNIFGGTIGSNTGTADISDGSYTDFTVLQTVWLASVKATVPAWVFDGNRSIEIENLTTGISKIYGPFNIKVNSVADINAILTAGNYRIFIRGGGVQTAPDWSGNGAALYSVKDYVNITGYSAVNNHGPFKQLTFKKTEACASIPVTIKEECIITNTVDNTNANIQISPNPFENTTTISVDTPSSIVVYDINGNVVEAFDNVNEAIVGNNLVSGIYFVSIQNGNGVFYQKIIKQ